jgi:guanylate kinase
MTRESAAFPVVISGPSGVGKTTLEERLVAADPALVASVSTTTRPPRDDEKHGDDYFFSSRDKFEKTRDTEMVEWAEVHGELYGTPRRFIESEMDRGRDVLLNIDVQGGIRVKKIFPRSVLIFILPPSFESLRERILKRGTDESLDLGKRLETAVMEITASDNYDYIVINDDLDRAVELIQAIIDAERCRGSRFNSGFVASLIKPETP